MIKRGLDLLLASAALVATAPVIAIAAVAVRLASPGPALYLAPRVGRRGTTFRMYKLRTMHVDDGRATSVITAAGDARVFPVGALLRRSKIDELPQLINVIRGQMSLVGPRPEDPRIVARHYAPAHRETLGVRPGLTSPGSLYYFTQGERSIGQGAPESDYLERVLPLKLALDRVYVRRASLRYDLALMARTAVTIVAALRGRRDFPPPPELGEASALVTPVRRSHRDPQRPRRARGRGPSGGHAGDGLRAHGRG